MLPLKSESLIVAISSLLSPSPAPRYWTEKPKVAAEALRRAMRGYERIYPPRTLRPYGRGKFQGGAPGLRGRHGEVLLRPHGGEGVQRRVRGLRQLRPEGRGEGHGEAQAGRREDSREGPGIRPLCDRGTRAGDGAPHHLPVRAAPRPRGRFRREAGRGSPGPRDRHLRRRRGLPQECHRLSPGL